MRDHDVREKLRASLQDGQLDRTERDELRAWVESSAIDGSKRAVYQSMAFDLAREAIEAKSLPHYEARLVRAFGQLFEELWGQFGPHR